MASLATSVAEWNRTERPYEREGTVGALFTQTAAANQGQTAVECGPDRMSYGELEQRSNQWARLLRGRFGIEPGSRVGVCMNRSVELAACLIGILKAGAAFVPFDPMENCRRLHAMAKNAGLSLVVSDGSGSEFFEGTSLLRLDAARRMVEAEDGSAATWEAGPLEPAYLMYTSGTTGEPKAVVVPHRGILRLVRNNPFAAMGPEETFLQMAPITFDASTFEIWGALLNGGRLVMMPPGPPAVSEIGRVIRERGVTTVWLTAGLFHLMVDEAVEQLRPLRQLLAGGDRLSPRHVARAMEQLPGTALINGYGPTETTTFACCHRISAEDARGGAIPIGRPIANTQVYVLDEDLQPVEAGQEGEIYIGGDGLALGYWKSPELTREKFLDDPFCGEPGAKLYRTSDRGRWRADGVVEFLGRADNQMKILGHRVEPEEIERAMKEHPLVRDVAVMARENGAEKQLVAWVVEGDHYGITPGALRAHLASRLPAYMIPASFISIDRLPLTANGKVNRAELAARLREPERPAETNSDGEGVEAVVAAAWRKVLGSGDFGMEENFFDAGGDSLRLIQLHSELSRTLAINIDVTDLFEYPTVQGLARRLESAGNRGLEQARARALRQRQAMGLDGRREAQEAAG